MKAGSGIQMPIRGGKGFRSLLSSWECSNTRVTGLGSKSFRSPAGTLTWQHLKMSATQLRQKAGSLAWLQPWRQYTVPSWPSRSGHTVCRWGRPPWCRGAARPRQPKHLGPLCVIWAVGPHDLAAGEPQQPGPQRCLSWAPQAENS